MSSKLKNPAVRLISEGLLVQRATQTIPQTTSTSIFTVSGGRVIVKALVGEVTTAIGAVAVNFNVTFTPTGGAAGDLVAATACISDAVGTLYSITGAPADLLASLKQGDVTIPNVTVAFAEIERGGIVLDQGSMKFKTSASTTGAVRWDIIYVPLDDGGTITAA